MEVPYTYDRILVFQGKWFPTLIIRGKDNYEEAFDDSGYREEYMGSGYYLKPYYYVNIKDIKVGSKNSFIKKQKLISHNQKFEVEADESNQYFEYFNPNPTSAWVGDCGTRAICVALNKSWKDVVLMVAEHSFRHRKPYKASYEDILIDNGFVEYPGPKAKGHRITVRKFIEQKAAEKYYKNRICFVVRGGYIPHMVTAKLEGDRYRIYDTWDSSVRYSVSPFAMLWNNDTYYLVGFHDHRQQITKFRVDRIVQMEVTDETAVRKPKGFDVSEFFTQEFSMLNGKECSVTLLCENILMNSIIDRFGEDVPVQIVDADHFTAQVTVDLSSNFYGWVFASAGKMKITAPQDAVEGFREVLASFQE